MTWPGLQMEARNAKSVRRIAKWVTGLMEPLDLTPSDSAVALVLVAALQRKRRRCPAPACMPDVWSLLRLARPYRGSCLTVTSPSKHVACLRANR